MVEYEDAYCPISSSTRVGGDIKSFAYPLFKNPEHGDGGPPYTVKDDNGLCWLSTLCKLSRLSWLSGLSSLSRLYRLSGLSE